MMLMHQMIGLARGLIARSFLLMGDLSQFGLLPSVALLLIAKERGGFLPSAIQADSEAACIADLIPFA